MKSLYKSRILHENNIHLAVLQGNYMHKTAFNQNNSHSRLKMNRVSIKKEDFLTTQCIVYLN